MIRLGDWLEPRRAAALLGLSIGVLATLGGLHAWRSQPWLSAFDLDGERNVPALFSAALLVACAALALALPRSVASLRTSLLFAAVLVFASLDEATEIHESLERKLDADWQLLYIPVFIAAAVVGVLIVVGLRRSGLGVTLVLASAGCWIASQALEALQWADDGRAPGYTWMMVVEETLEMTGSALLVVALLAARRAGSGES